MQLNAVASTVLVIFYIVTSIALVTILGFFLFALAKLNAKLELMEEKMSPLLVKTEEILSLTSEKITAVGKQTEGILTYGEAVAEEVHEKVDKTAITVQRTINAPIIGLNSVAAGLKHGLQTFSLLQRKPEQKREAVVVTQETVVIPSPISRYVDHSEPPAVEMAANSNGIPVALRAGKEN